MPETIIVKPVSGRKVRDPQTGKHIPDSGKTVIRSPYWTRRIKDGDVTKSTATKTKSKSTTPAEKAKE